MRWHCLECWEEFDAEDVGRRDDGIGAYEYWGMKGVDRHIVEVCPHCGEDVADGRLPSCDCGEDLTRLEYDNGGTCTACLTNEESHEEKTQEAEDQQGSPKAPGVDGGHR